MVVLLGANFVLLVIFLFINFILCLKRIPEDIPTINILFSIFTLIISVAVFLPDSNIPAQPYLTLLVALIGIVQLIINVLDTKV